MSDLTTPTRTRQRRRRIRSRAVRRALRGVRRQLRHTRGAVALVALLGATGVGTAIATDTPAKREAPQEAVALAEPVYLGKGAAGVKVQPELEVEEPVAVEPEGIEPATEAEGAGEPVGGGEASYYGRELAGNPTASGERFDPDGLTAAHRTLPLGSRLRVTNPSTGESVIVRVNDRGPFARHRVVDVSERAARELGMLRSGTARVELELLPKKRG